VNKEPCRVTLGNGTLVSCLSNDQVSRLVGGVCIEKVVHLLQSTPTERGSGIVGFAESPTFPCLNFFFLDSTNGFLRYHSIHDHYAPINIQLVLTFKMDTILIILLLFVVFQVVQVCNLGKYHCGDRLCHFPSQACPERLLTHAY